MSAPGSDPSFPPTNHNHSSPPPKKKQQQKDGSLKVQKQMTVTITCDHRHIYGADAAEFLRDLAELMEDDVESLLA